jgi:integrase
MTNKRTKLAVGIYQDNYARFVVARIGSGDHELTSPEIRFPLDTDIPTLQACWHREKMKLREQQAQAGGKVERGLLSDDVARYLRTATLTVKLKKERTQQLHWWLEHFGRRRRLTLTHPELLEALNTLKLANSTKDKYRTALSHVYTVLDGKNAANPFREIPRFEDPNDTEPRDQSYELIDAILANVRDHGMGGPSRTKAFLSVEAFAPVTRAQLTRMKSADVDWEASTITIRKRKKGGGSYGQTLDVPPEGLAAFRLFDAANCWGRHPSKSSIWRTFTKARDRAIAELRVTKPHLDLSRAVTMRPYDLRHSFGTLAQRQSKDVTITAAYLSHAKGSKVTQRYAQSAVQEQLKATGAAIAAAFAARPAYVPPPAPMSARQKTIPLRFAKRA